MPIYLIWGDDGAAQDREIQKLQKTVLDPSWISTNLSRLDGSIPGQANQALEESRTPPLGRGGRLVIIQNSSFCNGCTSELTTSFLQTIELIPEASHLVLCNSTKPDGRLKTTKALIELKKTGLVVEKNFLLPTTWDTSGQKELVEKTANELGLQIEASAVTALVEAIGNDSSRLYMELQKLSLHSQIAGKTNEARTRITADSVNALIEGITTNSFAVGDALIEGKPIEAIALIDALLANGEPPLRLLATLTGQIRGLLWISLLEKQGETDVGTIAKAAGIANPKRVYVMRKKLNGKTPRIFLDQLSRLIEIEAAIKKGTSARNAFRDCLLIDPRFYPPK
ncbi:DNA polymerase III subunit delta [Prochlorococcus sp. MIT 1300]|uniref:DNA polymerase III subunit delta n=1 Tax=Prochlorococcus sp. MIT 1300 TaxID=3096218 RepID=UPI002A761C72|nr:DNA polymerase III subunit delta [Prochlorococcus sp. MIT 1300]